MNPTTVDAGLTLCRTLDDLGATHVFALPGTQTVPLFEALRRSSLTTIVPTHELAASMMAAAYFRVCSRPGVLLTIPGPGFTYALTGLAEARLDSSALVYIVPAVTEGAEARYALQAIPQTDIAASLAKTVFHVDDASSLAAVVQQAYAVALTGEPGPVVVFLGAKGGAVAHAPEQAGRGDADQILEVWSRIGAARRPVIFAGQGCLQCAAALQKIAERIHAPVVTTASARGLLPEDHPLAMGFDAHRGTADAVNGLFGAADLVIVLGAKLGHNGTAGHALDFPPGRTVRVDTDPSIFQTTGIPVSLAAISTVEEFLTRQPAPLAGTSDWADAEISGYRLTIRTPRGTPPEPLLAGQEASEFLGRLRAVLPRDTVVVTDTGLHQVMVRRHLDILAPGGLLIPSDFQSMGFGLPAAIAAKLAAPDRPVVLLIGDGGMAMSGLELATAVRLGLSIPVVVFDDGQLNQIRLHQQAEFGADFGVGLPRIDFEALAIATGAAFAEWQDEMAAQFDAALSCGLPTLVRLPVGDSRGIRHARVVARTKAAIRRGLGDRLVRRLRQWLGRH